MDLLHGWFILSFFCVLTANGLTTLGIPNRYTSATSSFTRQTYKIANVHNFHPESNEITLPLVTITSFDHYAQNGYSTYTAIGMSYTNAIVNETTMEILHQSALCDLQLRCWSWDTDYQCPMYELEGPKDTQVNAQIGYRMNIYGDRSQWMRVGIKLVDQYPSTTFLYDANQYFDTSKILTPNPTINPTNSPTKYPTKSPTINPSFNPTNDPTVLPSYNPTVIPTISPTSQSMNPTLSPTYNPTNIPSKSPTYNPTKNPSISPTNRPTNKPILEIVNNPSNHFNTTVGEMELIDPTITLIESTVLKSKNKPVDREHLMLQYPYVYITAAILVFICIVIVVYKALKRNKLNKFVIRENNDNDYVQLLDMEENMNKKGNEYDKNNDIIEAVNKTKRENEREQSETIEGVDNNLLTSDNGLTKYESDSSSESENSLLNDHKPTKTGK